MLHTEVMQEIEFGGTSEEFVSQAQAFNHANAASERLPLFIRISEGLAAEIWVHAEDAMGYGYITTRSLPESRTMLQISANSEEDWVALEEVWDSLLGYLRRDGWVKGERKLERIAKRQSEVERLWTAGKIDEEIAEILSVGPRTVRRDRQKMGLKARY